jgi:hypothetical protein
LAGDVTLTFQAGVVVSAVNKLYVSPDVVAFRRRTAGPRGGQGLYVQGNYGGQLSARGGNVTLFDRVDRRVSALAYSGSPTPAQQYLRITEIMYHPPQPPPGSPFVDEDFEFIELKNTGPTALDLAGVRFSDGIKFSFTESAVKSLGAGRSVVVVKNVAAFKSGYGEGLPIAGTFAGNLDNAGEKIRLNDGVGETVLEFTYSDDWYPATDGFGYSLVVADETQPWTAWNDRSGWASSRALLGSPGQDEAEQAAWLARYFSFAEQADLAVSGDAADPDRDGFSNYQEYLSGTHPRDGQSYLKIAALSTAGDHPLIRFLAAEGMTYTIQYRDSAADGQWMTVADVPAQTATRLIEVVDPDASGRVARYYRLVTPQGP